MEQIKELTNIENEIYTNCITGTNGCGKTRYTISQIYDKLMLKENVLLITTCETIAQIKAILISKHIWTLFKIYVSISEILKDDKQQKTAEYIENAYADLFGNMKYGQLRIHQIDNLSASECVVDIISQCSLVKFNAIFIDCIDDLSVGIHTVLKIDTIINELSSYLNSVGITFTYVSSAISCNRTVTTTLSQTDEERKSNILTVNTADKYSTVYTKIQINPEICQYSINSNTILSKVTKVTK